MLRQRLLKFAAVFFLLLDLALAAAWIDSYYRVSAIAVGKTSNTYALVSADGRLIFEWTNTLREDEFPWPKHYWFWHWRGTAEPGWRGHRFVIRSHWIPTLATRQSDTVDTAIGATESPPDFSDVPVTFDIGGVIMAVGTGGYLSEPVFVFQLPYWLLITMTAYGCARPFWILFHERARRQPGHCQQCGYDLTGSTQRCPECGATVPSANLFARPRWRQRLTFGDLKRRYTMLTRYLRRNVYWIILTAMLLVIILIQNSQPILVRQTSTAFQLEEACLARPVHVNFQETPLQEVLEKLSHEASVTISLDELGRDNANVHRTTPITVKADTPLSLEDALQKICKQCAHLDFDIRGSTVELTENDYPPNRLSFTLVYQVGDLIIPPNLEGHSAECSASDLVRAIESNVHRDIWRDGSGAGPTITPFGDRLVVYAPHRVHREIADLLDGLRNPTFKLPH